MVGDVTSPISHKNRIVGYCHGAKLQNNTLQRSLSEKSVREVCQRSLSEKSVREVCHRSLWEISCLVAKLQTSKKFARGDDPSKKFSYY